MEKCENMDVKRALGKSLKSLLEWLPYEKITIAQIVDDAYVSRNTFYYHFKDKMNLALWTLTDDLKTQLYGQEAEGGVAFVHDMKVAMLKDKKAYIQLFNSCIYYALSDCLLDIAVEYSHKILTEDFGVENLSDVDLYTLVLWNSTTTARYAADWARRGMEDVHDFNCLSSLKEKIPSGYVQFEGKIEDRLVSLRNLITKLMVEHFLDA